MPDFRYMALGPAGHPDAALAIAASRAGAVGVLNLEFTCDVAAARGAVTRLMALGRGRRGVLVDASDALLATLLEGRGLEGLDVVLLGGAQPQALGPAVELVHGAGMEVCAVVTSAPAANLAKGAGADALVAKGTESGGWIGDEGAFVLVQRLLSEGELPVWVQGGIGAHTASACCAAGAHGAVLDSQLLLTRESPLPESTRARLRKLDGSQTLCLGAELGAAVRVSARPGSPAGAELVALERSLTLCGGERDGSKEAWREAIRDRVDWRAGDEGLLAIGQDGCFAATLTRRFATVGGIVAGLREATDEHLASAARCATLSTSSPLAESHRTRYPLVQGPMTRVSDRPEFAAAVAAAGALPFLALALMSGSDSEELLARTSELLADRAWGVGILGFVPPELRAEQMTAIRAHRPPFALIAGGRPDQAKALEQDGIATYLHVPSPGLLELYVKDGARRFVFEGRECGGHVGPRTSFVLWETMLETLLGQLPADASDVHVLLAGGIHDAMSAAMAATAAATLAERGVRIGALMGTAYLFTDESVRHGAITPGFQEAAIACDETVLLDSGPGHSTRCLPSPFVADFAAVKRGLLERDVPAEEIRNRLEAMNIGRLRLAAKGIDRNPRYGSDPSARKLTRHGPKKQWANGMYMIGQVAGLHDRACSMTELHERVADGGARRMAALAPDRRAAASPPPPADVAIVGMGCILPGASELEQLWANILDRADAITEVPAGRWDWRRYFDADRAAADRIYSRWGGFIDEVPFDPVAFGMAPAALPSIEPFQLLGLLVAQAALRDAGYAQRPFARERTSVIFGAGGGGADLAAGYTVRSSLPALFGERATELTARLGDALPTWTEDSFAGILMNVTSGRIANRLDLGGVNYTVDAACASSLAAVYLAVSHLQAGTSEMAIAGGVDAIQNPFGYLCFSKTQALSPNGRCRPFGAEADGIAISEGFAAVVLKRLADAERDGDRVYAVIRGVGGSSDGRDRSLTAPRPEGQIRALRRAYSQAGYSPAGVELIEAHGTGTMAGDRAEIDALRTVFEQAGARRQGTAIGSVKSNIGHTKATAGVAGVIKAALALHHRVLPPTLAERPSPNAGAPESPLYVNTQARPWLSTAAGSPRRAGVSAFGFGGTDFHVALEGYDGDPVAQRPPALVQWPAELFVWRGESRAELGDALGGLLDELEALAEEPRLIDVAHAVTLAAPRESRASNLAFVAQSIPDLLEKLRDARRMLGGDGEHEHRPGAIHYSGQPLAGDGSVAFLFPGQGSQYANMARELAVIFPEVRECFERADAVLGARFERPLSSFIFPSPAFAPDDERRQQAELTETAVAQPALGATELAMLGLLRRFGVEPQMTAGHSYGELVALAAAGTFDEADLIALSEARGRFIRDGQAGEPGTMAAIEAAPESLEPLLDDDPQLVLANLNGPHQTVISGARESVERALAWCRERDLGASALKVGCAFHSPAMAPAQRLLAGWLAEAKVRPPSMPVYANTTAGLHPSDGAAIAAVLSEQLVSPVQFAREIETMHHAGARVFVEVGPRSVLSGLVGRILDGRPHVCVPMERSGRPGLAQMLDCLATLAAEGVAVDVEELFRGRSVKALRAPAASPTTWMVNGGRARPLREAPREAPPPPVSVALLDSEARPLAAMNGSANGSGNGSPAAAAVHEAAGQPMTVTPTRGAAHDHVSDERRSEQPARIAHVGGDRVNSVMSLHQEVMQHFLETQKDVMLAYLAPRRAGLAELRQVAPPAAAPALPASLEPTPVALLPAPEPAPADGLSATEPAPVEVDVPPANGANGHVALTREQLTDTLIGVVSERTGFPPEMLTLDADLEADLSLDSIKRVEIAGTMLQLLALPDGAAPDVEPITASRTLREVVVALEAILLAPASAHNADLPPATSDEGDARPFERGPADERIRRSIPHAVLAPPAQATGGLASDGVVIIVDDETGVGAELERALVLRGDAVRRVVAGEAIGDGHGPAKALVHLASLAPGASDWRAAVDRDLLALFALTGELHEQLLVSAQQGGAVVLGATGLGHAFPSDTGEGAAEYGMVPGFLKSLAQEWPAVRVKAVALEPAAAPVSAQRLLAELLAADEIVEIGYRDGQRMRIELAPAGLAGRAAAQPLDEDCVILASGGARGITAESLLALARRFKPTIVLVGRTELVDEAAQTVDLSQPAELKQAIFDLRRQHGSELTLAAVERDHRRLLDVREVRKNIARLRDGGASIEYVSCDVRDAASFGGLIEHVYATHGRIDGVIHGAGVIEDRLVGDKQPESVRRVVETKLAPAYVLADRLRAQRLRFLVFFGSVAGRFGNAGQADYAAASDELNGLAQRLDQRWPGRVVTINWGPWAQTGMVSPELQRQLAQRGVELISPSVGCAMLLDELERGRKGETEVVIAGTAALDGTAVPGTPRRLALIAADGDLTRRDDGTVETLITLDPEQHLYLDDHRIDGRPVLPFAVAMELMAELAASGWPELDVAELREVRLLNGVVVGDGASPQLRIAATPSGEDGELSLDMTIDGLDEPARQHYRAIVDLRPRATQPSEPVAASAAHALDDLSRFPMDVAEAYERYLFHGPLLQGIVAIEGMDARGARALVRPSLPSDCLLAASPGAWLLDPVLVDCALQLQVLWARVHWDVTPLPTEVASLRRLGELPAAPTHPGSAAGLVRVELRIRSGSAAPLCRADHVFSDTRGHLLATLTDVVSPGSRALNRVANAA